MSTRITQEQANAEFRCAGLTPLTPYTRISEEREAVCDRCGTWRRVTLRAVRAPDCDACRWCAGWEKWSAWGNRARERASLHRPIRGIDFSRTQIHNTGLITLSELGDEFTPTGCLCLTCGETLVTVPERISADRPGWFACQRCYAAQTRTARTEADDVYARAGLRLLVPLLGQWTKYPAKCLSCGQPRHISYREAADGSGPSCWTCTHGIRSDEPHRVYLFRFPALGVLKIGITHNRHDRRLVEHQVQGGHLVETILVPDRHSALALEAWVLRKKAALLRRSVGPAHFPQGGWTEAWSESEAPAVNLAELHACLSQ